MRRIKDDRPTRRPYDGLAAPHSSFQMRVEILAQITAPHFCCGVVLWDDRVVEVAPIVRYMKGWSRERVRDYCAQKGWQVAVVYEQRQP